MLSFPRKLLALYLAASTLFAPILPAFAASPHEQNLPELGSSVSTTPAPSASPASKPTPEWLLQAATDPDLAPSVVRPRDQGIEQAVAQGAGMLSSAASEATESWFAGHHITAELALKIDNKGVHGGSLDMLVPFYNAGEDLVFTQVGIRRANTYTEDYRNIVNLGLGYRRNVGDWLLGANSFYDRDLTGKNDRLGVGIEAWTDFLKLSANSYMPLSSWKVSPDQIGYLERPAKGWDVRAEGYLPAYPQLGGKLTYEQYYGKEVSLFSSSDRQKDPRAVTVGVMYNPVPIVGIGVDHRMGQGGLSDTSANLTFTYRMGESFAKQMSSDNLIASRLLANTRYNLVNRNNEMVMDNRKDTVQLRLPATLSVAENQTVQFAVTGASSLSTMNWSGSAAGFAMPYGGGEQAWLTLPAYKPTVIPFSAQPNGSDINSYSLQAMGTDKAGRAVASNVMTVMVYSVDLAVAASPTSIQANGTSTTTLSATIKGTEGQSVGAGLLVNWKTSAGTLAATSSSTNDQGIATITLTSPTQAGTATVDASTGSATGSTTVSFTAGAPASGSMSVQATPVSITADGTSTTTLTTTLKDDHGNVTGAGSTVNWTTSMGTLASASTDTDSNGVATVVLTSSTTAGTATVQALSGNAQNNTSVTFTPGAAASGNAGLSLTLSDASLPADGTSTSTVVALVKDTHGNPVGAGTSVSWSTTAGALDNPTSITDTSGKASVLLTSATATGTATITASAGAANHTATVTFTAGIAAAGSSGLTLSATPVAITADGSSTSTVSATVTDVFGNTLPAGVQVNWTTDAGSLVGSTSSTDANGVATMVLTSSTMAGTASVQATAAAAHNTLAITFNPGAPAAGRQGLTLSVITAAGADTATLNATVKDVNGNRVGAGVVVSWSTSTGTLGSAITSTNNNGVASVLLTNSEGGAQRITVEATSGAASDSANIAFNAGVPAVGSNGISLEVGADDGSHVATITATVLDGFGDAVGAGVLVNWQTTSGSLTGASSTTNASGVATMVLTGSQGTSADVTASSGAASNSITVSFTPGYPAGGSNGISLSVTPPSLFADGSSTATVIATLRDSKGQSVGAGVRVNWNNTLGTLSATSSTTDASGMATVTVTSATTADTATVTASVGKARNSVEITYLPGAPAGGSSGLSLAANPTSIVADGSSTTQLRATVKDSHGNAVGAGIAVTWTTDAGTLNIASSTTDAKGETSVVLTSSTALTTATVQATAGAAQSSASVAFVAGAPASIKVISSLATLIADGVSTTTLTATVVDAQNHPVPAGLVKWTTTSGTLTAATSLTDNMGIARMVLTSPTVVGTATVNGSIGIAIATTSVSFTRGALAKIAVTTSSASIPGDGASTATLTARVTDANGNPMGAGVTVSWSVSSTHSKGTLSATSSTTDANGVASVTLTSARGWITNTISASVGGVKGSVDVTYALLVVITSSANPVPRGGQATLSARVTTPSGTPMTGIPVKWIYSDYSGLLTTQTATTDSIGVAIAVAVNRFATGPNQVIYRMGVNSDLSGGNYGEIILTHR